MKRFLFVLLTLPIFAFADGGLPTQPYIYVEGKAEIEKPADLVTLRFDLVARNPDQTKANEEVQTKASKILSMLNEKRIAQNDVIASDLKSEPVYEHDEEDSYRKRGKIAGYKVTRSFAAKVRDIKVFPKVVDELLAIAGVEFSGIDPSLSKEKEMQDEIWKKALINARERAEKTLKEMGMQIDSVFAVSPVAFPQIRSQLFQSYQDESRVERAIVTGPPEYRLGPVTINQSIHVIYLISPAK